MCGQAQEVAVSYGMPGTLPAPAASGLRPQTYAPPGFQSGSYGPALGGAGSSTAATWLELQYPWQQRGGMERFSHGPLPRISMVPGPGAVGTNIAGGSYGAYAGPKQDAFRFGLTGSALTVGMGAAGLFLDKMIERRMGGRGYGPVMGAALGNALNYGLAETAVRGPMAGVSIAAGALLPVAPLAWAMFQKKRLTGQTKSLVIGSSVLLGVLAFLRKG